MGVGHRERRDGVVWGVGGGWLSYKPSLNLPLELTRERPSSEQEILTQKTSAGEGSDQCLPDISDCNFSGLV